MAIISLTTIPSRLEHGIQPTLESLSKQGYDVYLWIPKVFKRKNIKFNGHIPDYIKKLGIKYHVVEDLGSITKLVPAFDLDDNVIITADDDVIYPKGWADGLVNAYKDNPNRAYCYRGRIFKNEELKYKRATLIRNKKIPRYVDVITGIWGALYDKRVFGKDFKLPQKNDDGFFVDDIWISGYLAEHGVDRICLPNPGIENSDNHMIDALTTINWGRGNSNNTNTAKLFDWKPLSITRE